MEKYLEHQEKALFYLKAAEQSLKFTYPLVKENKVLLTLVNQLFLSCANIISSLLHYEFLHKRLFLFQDNFEARFTLMKTILLERYHLDKEYLLLTRDLKDLILAHQRSPMEFSRGERFIICNENYEFKQIDPKSMEKALAKTKLFIGEVINITSR